MRYQCIKACDGHGRWHCGLPCPSLFGGDMVDIPDDATISDGDNNGCYVMGWVWCNFEGTELDKNNV